MSRLRIFPYRGPIDTGARIPTICKAKVQPIRQINADENADILSSVGSGDLPHALSFIRNPPYIHRRELDQYGDGSRRQRHG